MGIIDVLSMDMGWTDTTSLHHHHYLTQSVVNNITSLSSCIVAAPTQPLLPWDFRRVLERGAMVSFFGSAQSVPFLELVRRCGFLAIGRLLSTSAGKAGKAFTPRWPMLLQPNFLARALWLGLTTFMMELWLNLFLAQNYRMEEGKFSWRELGRDARRWTTEADPNVVGWLCVPLLVALLLSSKIADSGAWTVMAWLVIGMVLFAWYCVTARKEDGGDRKDGDATEEEQGANGLDSPESPSDGDGKAIGKGGKKKGKSRKAPKKTKKSMTF